MFREQSLTGLGKEARNMVLTFTWLFYYAVRVTLSSWEGKLAGFFTSSLHSPSSVTIYNLPLFPLKVNVISLSFISSLLICTIQKILSVFSDRVSYCRHVAANHTASAASSLPLCMLPAASSQNLPCPLLFGCHVLYSHVGSDLLYF